MLSCIDKATPIIVFGIYFVFVAVAMVLLGGSEAVRVGLMGLPIILPAFLFIVFTSGFRCVTPLKLEQDTRISAASGMTGIWLGLLAAVLVLMFDGNLLKNSSVVEYLPSIIGSLFTNGLMLLGGLLPQGMFQEIKGTKKIHREVYLAVGFAHLLINFVFLLLLTLVVIIFSQSGVNTSNEVNVESRQSK